MEGINNICKHEFGIQWRLNFPGAMDAYIETKRNGIQNRCMGPDQPYAYILDMDGF
jgi:hypothetical protein